MTEAQTTDYPRGFTPTPESENLLFRVATQKFEGPLDLLLFLIKKHDLDIFDIPIALITKGYLEHLDAFEASGWQDVSLDTASGFLALAAELAHIKSRMLVPQPEDVNEDGEEIDPRADLVRRLLDYQKYKEAGEQLKQREVLGRDVFARHVQVDPSLIPTETPLADVSLFKLVEALDRVFAAAKIELKHEVVLDQLSVADKLHQLIERLGTESVISFFSLFSGLRTRREIIAMFLAVLEVAKMKLVRLQQETAEGDIILRTAEDKLAEFHADNAAPTIDYR
jgi:segregation and condensation protein A